MPLQGSLSSFYTCIIQEQHPQEYIMAKKLIIKKFIPRLVRLSYLLLSWSLLLWLNFNMEANVFAHLIAIPSLLLMSALAALPLDRPAHGTRGS
jgi:hypothetical protein